MSNTQGQVDLGAGATGPIGADRTGVRWLELSVVGGTVVADQLAKAAVLASLALHDGVTVVPGVLSLTYVRNTGAAFGLLNDADFPFKTLAVTLMAVTALALIAVYTWRTPIEDRVGRFGLSLILGGAIGNLIDRARFGYVVDYVDVYWRDYHFWAFNVADAAITVGALIILAELVFVRRHVPPAA